MKPLILSALLAGLLVTASCGSDSSASANVVARVNGKDISTAELEKQVQVQLNGAEKPGSAEEQEDMKLQVLNQLINNQILLELASAANLNATDAEVDVKFNELKSQGTEEQFKEMLKNQKMTVDDVRSELRKSIAIDKLVNKEITSKISVTDAEIKAFYDKNKESFNLPESYHIAHILVTPVADPDLHNANNDDAKSPEEAKAKAARLLKEIQGGKDFATVARESSEDPSSGPNGGDLNFQPLQAIENIDPRLGPAVQKMKVGETYPQVIETRFGFHILKLLEKDAGGQKDLADARVQANVRQQIFNRKDQTLKNAFSEASRNKATVVNYLAQRILDNAGKAQ
ncbi:MAG TPA: peptidylprolyl isomerase [Terriglobia bacterium]|jgi:peptidyl-prolyl cis-trans isomerase SurA